MNKMTEAKMAKLAFFIQRGIISPATPKIKNKLYERAIKSLSLTRREALLEAAKIADAEADSRIKNYATGTAEWDTAHSISEKIKALADKESA